MKNWMRQIMVTVLLVSICVCLSVTAWAETYYVRPDGANSNTGIENSSVGAWQTMQYAADSSAPGDIILVQPGVYQENVTIKNSGTAELPILFRGEGDVTVGSIKFVSSGVFSRVIQYFVTIESMTLDGALNMGSSGISMTGTSDVQITDSKFINYSSSGITFGNNGWAACSRISLNGCIFEDNRFGAVAGGSGMLTNSVFNNCTFSRNSIGYYAGNWGTRYVSFANCLFDNNETGVVLEGVYWYWLKTNNNIFQRSIFANNGIGLRIGDVGASSYNGCSYANKVINSDFYNNTEAGVVVSTNFTGTNSGTPEYYDAQGQTFTNNIFLSNGGFGLDNAVNQTIFASYNIAFDNGIAPGNNAEFSVLNSSLLSDPKLVNPAAGNFGLGFGSPAIDTGNPEYDIDPVTYGEHVDIGAVEFTTIPPVSVVAGLIDTTEAIPESFFKNTNNSIPLSKNLFVAMQMIIRGDEETDLKKKENFYHSALKKLENSILTKTDGCALGGVPDANDWVTDCATQADFYTPIINLIEYLQTPLY
jgi:hypothetical protein